MEDIFILEDNPMNQDRMTSQIPDGLTHRLATNGKEFEDYVAEGCQAKLYFLDDEVPDASGRKDFHFIKHCSHLLQRQPEAKVFYTGSMPWDNEKRYCREHNIPMVDRGNIGEVINRELGE